MDDEKVLVAGGHPPGDENSLQSIEFEKELRHALQEILMSEQLPTFSVVMPVYNQARYLEEAIASVLSQSFQDWELIIVNDGSSDASAQIIHRFSREDDRIRAFYQDNRGAAAARNRGIAMSRASWLCYLDSDDVWFAGTLKAYYEYIIEHPEAQFIYGYRHRLKDGKLIHLKGTHQDAPTGPRELFQKTFLSPLRVCHRRELIDLVGGYDENLPRIGCEDYDLSLRMSRYVTFEPIGIATGLRRRHGHNKSRQTGYSLLVEAAVLMRFLEDYGGNEAVSPTEANVRLGRTFYAAGREYFRRGCFRQCLDAMEKGHKYGIPRKGKVLEFISRILFPFGIQDKRPSPFPLSPPCWHIK